MFIMLSVLIIFLGSAGEAQSAPACKSEVARVVSMQGTIEIRRAQENIWQQAGMEVVLCAGDMIRARSHSRAALRLSNNSMLRLDQKTSITFPVVQEEKGASLLDLFEGAIHIITRTPKPFKIRTPFVNASVEGTEFLVGLKEDNAEVVVYEGKVSVSNELGSLLLHDHEAAITHKGQAPRKEIIIRPADAVQWALYYPVILDYWQSGDKDNANANDLIRQAGQLLTAGQADEAKEIIQQVLQLEPNNSHAHALLAIIALVQNEKDQALELASKAVALDQQSAAGYLALSYTQQAHFEIEVALESVQKALASDAQNALIWARLAELQMSVGYLERALDAAKLAVSLNPGLAKTQTVLGFAHLLQIDTQTAKDIFHRAIALDQADPMPRLGLGLALIREGELEAGRIELEIAASLDPANSLIRSYLGKAYFEEKRYPLASTQFDLAKERDPKDPTPWFYDAIQKQTQNRPVEALQDIQKSIELNNNRAVYRSQFLLDRDEAARGSSLARIFENLGFERRAVMETAKSLSFDPANHSAHRFLSDTYANTPRHEIARVSELLQAQLLQPINVNPVQPHMAVADLNIITSTGPSAAGFNEFAPLMERNKSQVVASGVVGSNSTIGDEVVASALYDRASISMGQFHYETNGFRPNNDQKHNVYNAFIQYAVTPRLNVQVELRKRESEHGDLLLDFDKNKFDREFRRNVNEDIARAGARYTVSSNQDLLLNTKFINREGRSSDTEGYQVELQHLFRKNYFNSTIGGGTYRFTFQETSANTRLNKDNIYIYTNANFLRNLNATFALSYDSRIGADDQSKENINPKLGLQWDLNNKFRFRAAWINTTKSPLVAQQTLEPTQVAGFNQFFDDTNGTRAQRIGAALDYRMSNDLYSGIEASERELKVPYRFTNLDSSASEASEKQNEQLYRAYLYWIPHTNWIIRSELEYEQFSRNAENSSISSRDPVRIQTFSTPFNIEYFNPLGVFFRFTTTYVTQDLVRKEVINGNIVTAHKKEENSGFDSFNLVDTSVGYRLPRRKGIISLEVKNLFNENFFYRTQNFFTSEPINPRYVPGRTIFFRLTLNF
ncbi:TonB-dependent receptor [Nitrosomonas oligotropha]|nr:TonB-dependent receptor [Nitrosomonas oligotropha]